jgi:peptide/nickel transport system permease protein
MRFRHPTRLLGSFLLSLWLVVTLSYFLRNLVGVHPHLPPRFNSGGARANRFAATVNGGGSPLGDYMGYLGRVLHLQFGQSLAPPFFGVDSLVGHALPWTLLLVGIGTLISIVIGTVLGAILAWNRGTLLDTLLMPAAMFASSIPYYLVALIFAYGISIETGWFPSSYAYSPDLDPSWSGLFLGDVVRHAVLPVLTVVVATFGLWVLPMRNSMIGVLNDDFMLLGRAKGLSSLRLIVKYASRNALLPVATNFAIQFGYVLGGALFVEVVFNYPGVGWLLVVSVYSHDYPTVQALSILVAGVGLLTNLGVRLLYPWLDARTRLG